jgi:hypothetical protein
MSEPVIIPPTCQILCAAEVPSLDCNTRYFWEALEADFTVPAVTGTADIAVCNSSHWGVGAYVWIQGAGFFEITSRPNTTSIRVQNNGHAQNAAPTSVIGAGALIVHRTPMMLTEAIVDAIMGAVGAQPTITVSDEDTNVVTVTIQMKDALNNDLDEYCLLHIWLSDASMGALGTAPDGGVSATTGAIIEEYTATTDILCRTDANGELVLEFTESGALTSYINADIQGKIVVGDQSLVWA